MPSIVRRKSVGPAVRGLYEIGCTIWIYRGEHFSLTHNFKPPGVHSSAKPNPPKCVPGKAKTFLRVAPRAHVAKIQFRPVGLPRASLADAK